MELEKTTIIPMEDQQQAQELFKNAIAGENVLVMVVLGDDDAANRVVKEADRTAKEGVQMGERKVIWIKDKTFLEEEIKALNAGAVDISDEDLTGIVAFSISRAKNVMCIIRNTDDVLELRVGSCFLEAGRE